MANPYRTNLPLAMIASVACCTGLQATEQDARIVAAAHQSYVFKTHLKQDKIQVTSRSGRVTLTGTVQSQDHRTLAEDTVAGLPGVKEVLNQLQVIEDPGLDTADGKLRTKVQVALFFHRNLSAAKTVVAAKDGIITLKGEADSEAQKALTTEYVKDIDGVSQVINEMTVAKPPRKPERELKRKIDDASLTAQLKAALLFNRGTSALHTKVVTKGGVVTLSGKARTPAERELCSKIAHNLQGVHAVRNQMRLED